ncbi:FtsX-like permease family protein [Bifidobacterium pseudolongum]|uniref:FtsX-like permease family protein n=1 Tax=Bifidobacterium pseudolongum TaxID=1694 RepID=UPI003F91BA75
MSTFALWRLFHRPAPVASRTGTRAADSTTLLAVVAFAAATTIFLTVLGGLHGFIWRASPDHTIPCLLSKSNCDAAALAAHNHAIAASKAASDQASLSSTYIMLAVFACLLLLVPFAALAGSAARLAASRRDARLAALRLAGATTSQVVRLTAFDSALQALGGALIGIAGYFALMPLIMLLTFQNQHFTFAQLWVGPIALVATVAGVTLLALVSALLTLRRVAITPLGVSARQGQPLPSSVRLVIFLVALVGALAVLSNMQLINAGTGVMIAIIFGLVIGCFALINLVGSFAVTLRARSRARRPKNAATMIAMRRILDNPKRAWRNVSGIGLSVFIAGITSVCALFGSSAGGDVDSAATVMMQDIGTGGLLTLAFAGVLAAVSSGVMQSASVIDQANEYHMLVLEGTSEATLRRARFAEVLTPLNTVVVLAAACSALLLVPLVGNAFTQPGPLISFVGGVALCYALVIVGAVAANRTAARVARATTRADD